MADDTRARTPARSRAGSRRSGVVAPTDRRRRRASGPDGTRAPRPTGRVLGGPPGSWRRGIPSGEKAADWRPTRDQLDLLASLIDAGVSVADAFATLERTATSRRTRTGAGTVARRIGQGVSIATALEEIGVPAHVVALVAAGERTGRVADALRGSGTVTGRMEELNATIGRALVYPAVVLAVGLVMLMLIAVTVVPQLERTFVELGGELPRPTRIVIAASDVLRSVWFVAAALTVLVLWRPIRGGLDRVGLSGLSRALPVVRRFHSDVAVTVISRLVATMLAGGVPFVDALRESARALPHGGHRERVLRAAMSVEQGGSAFDEDALGPLIGPVDREILGVAERTGLLTEQWRRVAERRGQALDERVARVGAALEPVLVVIVGAIVGGAVISLYLPTFRILDLI